MHPAEVSPELDAELRAQRTYRVNDEHLRAFGQLSYAQRLHWVEQCSHFVRMVQAAKAQAGTAQLIGA